MLANNETAQAVDQLLPLILGLDAHMSSSYEQEQSNESYASALSS